MMKKDVIKFLEHLTFSYRALYNFREVRAAYIGTKERICEKLAITITSRPRYIGGLEISLRYVS